MARPLVAFPPASLLLKSRSSLSAPPAVRKALDISSRQYASSSPRHPEGKPIPLEQPDKFRPPSHPARLSRRNQRPMNYPGIPLTPQEREVQKTKRYPHTFPPEGTWLNWFLNNRAIHLFITLVSFRLYGMTRVSGPVC